MKLPKTTCTGMPARCTLCAGIGYVRCELPPGHALFGQPISCPECGKQAQLDALGKRWPVTAE